jgi:hypothetical protein
VNGGVEVGGPHDIILRGCDDAIVGLLTPSREVRLIPTPDIPGRMRTTPTSLTEPYKIMGGWDGEKVVPASEIVHKDIAYEYALVGGKDLFFQDDHKTLRAYRGIYGVAS